MRHLAHHGSPQARLVGEGAGRFRLEGDVGFDTVMHLLHDSRPQFEHEPHVRLDFSGVENIDSAGLALVIEWMREAQQKRHNLEIRNPPERLLALARISDVERLLKPLIVTGSAPKNEAGEAPG
jgi:phospholipid transport system transporter-binding protein